MTIENDKMLKYYMDMIYLASCAVQSKKPDALRVKDTDLMYLFKISKTHTMEACVYMAIESSGILKDKEWLKEQDEKIINCLKVWKDRKDKAIRKNMLLDAERKKLFDFMDQNGIWYMPLKGAILKDYYPKVGMRQMSDNDILFDQEYRKEVKKYFASAGYKVKKYNRYYHDEYEKLPIYNYEMHVSLLSEGRNQVWYNYYRNVKDRLIKDNNNKFGYHFTDDDYYVYFVFHAYKHYAGDGTGIRTFMDSFILQNSRDFNYAYIEEQCELLGIKEYEQGLRNVSKKIFENGGMIEELTDDERMLLLEGISSKTYGTEEIKIKNKLLTIQNDGQQFTKKTKLKYILRRIFPEMKFYQEYYPIVYKYKILIPFFWLKRLIIGPFKKRKHIKNEIEYLKKKP